VARGFRQAPEGAATRAIASRGGSRTAGSTGGRGRRQSVMFVTRMACWPRDLTAPSAPVVEGPACRSLPLPARKEPQLSVNPCVSFAFPNRGSRAPILFPAPQLARCPEGPARPERRRAFLPERDRSPNSPKPLSPPSTGRACAYTGMASSGFPSPSGSATNRRQSRSRYRLTLRWSRPLAFAPSVLLEPLPKRLDRDRNSAREEPGSPCRRFLTS
jgi:hypothetical protein